jgi:hypothetical protein
VQPASAPTTARTSLVTGCTFLFVATVIVGAGGPATAIAAASWPVAANSMLAVLGCGTAKTM